MSGAGFPRATSSPETVAPKIPSSPLARSTASITSRLADDASPTGQRPATRLTASTAPGSIGRSRSYPANRPRTFSEWQDFSLAAAAPDEPPVTRRLHIGFVAPSRERVDDFWRAGVEAGYADDGRPGLRPEYGPDYYGGFLLDPDGNSAEAVYNEGGRGLGAIDHLWLRVRDLEAARGVSEQLAPRTGFELGWTHEDPQRFGFRGDGASLSVVSDGEPTRNVVVEFDGGGFELDGAGRLTAS